MHLSTFRRFGVAIGLFGIAAATLAAPRPANADEIRAVFDCEGGQTLDVTFDNDKDVAVITIAGEKPLTLPIAMSGSGYRYSDGDHELSGKGDEAMWQVGDKAPVNCKAAK